MQDNGSSKRELTSARNKGQLVSSLNNESPDDGVDSYHILRNNLRELKGKQTNKLQTRTTPRKAIEKKKEQGPGEEEVGFFADDRRILDPEDMREWKSLVNDLQLIGKHRTSRWQKNKTQNRGLTGGIKESSREAEVLDDMSEVPLSWRQNTPSSVRGGAVREDGSSAGSGGSSELPQTYSFSYSFFTTGYSSPSLLHTYPAHMQTVGLLLVFLC
jgi:hypothetical protein